MLLVFNAVLMFGSACGHTERDSSLCHKVFCAIQNHSHKGVELNTIANNFIKICGITCVRKAFTASNLSAVECAMHEIMVTGFLRLELNRPLKDGFLFKSTAKGNQWNITNNAKRGKKREITEDQMLKKSNKRTEMNEHRKYLLKIVRQNKEESTFKVRFIC